MIYKRKKNQQVLNVVPITSILSKLPVVPVENTGTIPFSMQAEAGEFPGASCDSRPDAPHVVLIRTRIKFLIQSNRTISTRDHIQACSALWRSTRVTRLNLHV